MIRILALLLLMALGSGCTGQAPDAAPTLSPSASPTASPSASPSPVPSPSTTPKRSESEQMKLNQSLLAAAKAGRTAEALQLLKDGANVNAQDGSGRTPLMLATLENNAEMAKVLIEAGADVNIQADNKDNPYLYAGAEGYLEILKLTIEAGADTKLTNRFGGTALIPAGEHAHNEVIEYLLTKSDVDVNHINNLGWTALMEAVVLGSGGQAHQRAVELLIEHGADVNIPDSNGVTALSHARSRGFKEIANQLEQAGGK